MSREDVTWAGLALILLIGGLLVGQRFSSPQPDQDRPADPAPFRQWLWEWRSLDLAVQAGLILTGALAIAALLPRAGEVEDGAAPGDAPLDKAP